MLTKNLNSAFERTNLIRAWNWINANGNFDYKNHFRSLYKAYSLSLNENIDSLRADLLSSKYKAQHSTKLYIPKKSGILRPYSLLNINDQVVYLSLISIIAEKLHPKVKKYYNKRVFGNLYNGKDDTFFYQKWSKGYSNFNSAITDAYNNNFVWTATFDLTAFYDSIDHKVLSHFLLELGLEQEFITFLTNCLETWTASSENRIYHGHGIPQGPLPSGILSEVILNHFDSHKKLNTKTIKYFRYVDDIRIQSETETTVRKALLELDYISKEIGLFPQSNKINIHKITDLNEEIKSISIPPEPIDFSLTFNQKLVIQKINSLTPRFNIENETKFKYSLAHASPNADLALRLLRILEKQPHLYQSIFRHLSKYPKFTKRISVRILELLSKEQLYEEVTATYLITSLHKIHESTRPLFKDYCLKTHTKRRLVNSPNLRSIIFVWLINENHFKYTDIEKIYKSTDWWLIHNSLEYIDIDLFGRPSYQDILNILIKSVSFEVAIKAAYLIVEKNLSVIIPLRDININAQTILKQGGKIGKKQSGQSLIPDRLFEVLDVKLPLLKWKKLLTTNHDEIERKALLLSGYFKTDASAFINSLDVFNDHLFFAIAQVDPRLTYTVNLGGMGSLLHNTPVTLLTYYPKFTALCKEVHNLRLISDLSHPITKTTGKSTRRIKFYEIKKLQKKIEGAYTELITQIIPYIR